MLDPTLLADLATDIEPAGSLSRSPSPCTNCGEPMDAPYCPRCGQKRVDLDPKMGDLVHEAVHELSHLDGKLLSTVRLLVTKPGELTREFLAGRRVRYISPIRLYLTCSVLYFFISALAPKPIVVRMTDGDNVIAASDSMFGPSSDTGGGQRADTSAKRVAKQLKLRLAAAFRDPERLRDGMRSAMPKAMFVLVPAFAGLIAILYRNRRRRYPQHFYFAIHIHAFLFLAMMLARATRLTRVEAVGDAADVIVALVVPWYLVVALRRVYGGRLGPAVLRGALATAAYFMIFGVTAIAVFGVVIMTM